MFNECSYNTLGNLSGAAGKAARSQFIPPPGLPTLPPDNLTAAPLWQQLQYSSKQQWKQSGRPTTPYNLGCGPGGSGGGCAVPGPGGTPIGMPLCSAPGADQSNCIPDTTPGTSGGLSSLLSGIPSSYLLIGAAIILVMVLKK